MNYTGVHCFNCGKLTGYIASEFELDFDSLMKGFHLEPLCEDCTPYEE